MGSFLQNSRAYNIKAETELAVILSHFDESYIYNVMDDNLNMLNQKFTVTFTDGKVAVYSFGELDQIVLAYAVSIHKSQGSEFDTVVISVSQGNPFLLTRNLLYTAITRAKKTVVVVGTKEAVGRMVRNNYTATRYSLLKEFVREEVGHDE